MTDISLIEKIHDVSERMAALEAISRRTESQISEMVSLQRESMRRIESVSMECPTHAKEVQVVRELAETGLRRIEGHTAWHWTWYATLVAVCGLMLTVGEKIRPFLLHVSEASK